MFPVQNPSPQKLSVDRISLIKAKIDNKISTLFFLLNKVSISKKDDKICQTTLVVQENPHQNSNLLFKRENSNSETKYYPRSYESTEVGSNSSLSYRFLSSTDQKYQKSRNSVLRTTKNGRGVNKSLEFDITPKKEKRVSKISHKNQDFQKILKDRKRKKQLKRKEREQNPVEINKELLSKIALEIRESSRLERTETEEGRVVRKKLILKLADQYFPLL